MHWSSGRRIFLGFSIALVLLIVNAVISYRNVVELSDNDLWVSHTYNVIGELEGVGSSLKEAESNQRAYLITNSPRYLEPYRAAVESSRARMAALRKLTADNPVQQKTLAALNQKIEARLDFLEQTLSLGRDKGLAAIRDSKLIDRGQQLMDDVNKDIRSLHNIENDLLRTRANIADERYERAVATVVIATALGLVLIAAGFGLLRSYLVGQQAAAEQLRESHAQLEVRVRERTADLAAINRALESEVTARKRIAEELERAHHELQSSNARLAAILEGTSDQIAAVDLEGRFILFNQAYARQFADLFGRQPALGHLLAQEVPTTHGAHDRKLELWRRAMAGEEFTVTEDFGRPSQGPQFFEITFGSIRDLQGRRIGASHIGRDVTHRVLAEQQLDAYATRLMRSNRELEEFASVASHDLQEPLRKIQAFGDRLDNLCGGQLPEQAKDYLGRMLQASVRMRSLINDLLIFSRVSTRALPFKRVDLEQVAREVLSDLEERIRQTGGRVEIGNLPAIDADALQMRQLLQNLIGNALKFHVPDRPPVVRVEAYLPSSHAQVEGNGAAAHQPPPGSCRIVVSDNGIGFDIKYLDRIFNVFQRLHGRGQYEGTGMGLAICRKIVERHSGAITATSTPGQGASFIITLPLAHTSEGEQLRGQTGQTDHDSDG